MAGLDRGILNTIEGDKVVDRIKIDLQTDFILAPHYNSIFLENGAEVWTRVSSLLESGDYQPTLPFTISVPKGRGFTRPGSILSPIDRFVYQALIDLIAANLEEQLDRTRTFSHVISDNEESIFEPSSNCWQNFQNTIATLCTREGYIVKADVANYFERIPQHHLINLMRAAGCTSGVVNLLEEVLLSFQERNSFGIIQGVFPSDILGNFFLSDFDAYSDLHNIPSARYMDDIYLHFDSRVTAEKGLINLIERLRKNGLHLNESKSGILTTQEAIREETEVDTLLNAAREEVKEELPEDSGMGYGFAANWELDEEYQEPEEDIEVEAVKRLYQAIREYPNQSDKVEKFCLPILRVAGSDFAVENVLSRLVSNPHLTRVYYSYLSRFVGSNTELINQLEAIVRSTDLGTDYQKMYLLGSLLHAESITRETINQVIQWLEDARINQTTRALAAVFAAKHGNANQKRAIRVAYENEQSSYVRSAILYSAKYMPSDEKRACKRAWGGHNEINALITEAM